MATLMNAVNVIVANMVCRVDKLRRLDLAAHGVAMERALRIAIG